MPATTSIYAKQATRLHPFTIPKIMHNAPTLQIPPDEGPSLSTATACSSSGHAIGGAFHLIKMGMADIMLTGGAISITFGMMRSWESIRVLASGNGTRPAAPAGLFPLTGKASLWAKERGVLLLEELEHARKRGAIIYAEVVGFGMSSDASHITQPSLVGPARAIRMALDEGGVNPEEVDYINAHGTGTPLNDVTETQVIKDVFKDHARRLTISSTKSMHGHAMGATGAIRRRRPTAVDRGIIPPNYSKPDPACDLDYVP